MTKKQLEEKVERLERELSELKSQMLTLALSNRTTFVPVFPAPQPPVYPQPPIIPWSPTWPNLPERPIITCSATSRGTIQ